MRVAPPCDTSADPIPAAPAAGWWCYAWCPSNRTCACRRNSEVRFGTRLLVPITGPMRRSKPYHRLLHRRPLGRPPNPFRRQGTASTLCGPPGVEIEDLAPAGKRSHSKPSSRLRTADKSTPLLYRRRNRCTELVSLPPGHARIAQGRPASSPQGAGEFDAVPFAGRNDLDATPWVILEN